MESSATPPSSRTYSPTPHPALKNLLEINFPSFWLLLGAPRNMWEILESILAARKWFWLPLVLSVWPPRRHVVCPGSRSVCLGNNSVCPGNNSVCLESNSVCAGSNSVCLGSNSVCPGSNSVCPGSKNGVLGGAKTISWQLESIPGLPNAPRSSQKHPGAGKLNF